jgi:hypothetical protein
MTKKDFELIAEVIAHSWHGSAELKRDLANNMANALAGTNDRFDSSKFVKACLDGGQHLIEG